MWYCTWGGGGAGGGDCAATADLPPSLGSAMLFSSKAVTLSLAIASANGDGTGGEDEDEGGVAAVAGGNISTRLLT